MVYVYITIDVITWQCLNTMAARKKAWSPPQKGWLKFNIGVDWNVRNQRGRAAWGGVRDTSGRVLNMHSKRAFVNVTSLQEAKFKALLWTIESMITRPKAWSNIRY